MVKFLLENNANINAVDMFNYTPLMWACYRGRNDIIELLLKNKANLNHINNQGLSCKDIYKIQWNKIFK